MAKESAKAIAANLMDGKDITVPEEEFQRRMVICRKCPRFKPDTAQCLECGCFLNFKAKLNDMKCPLDKWKLTTPSNDTSTNPEDN